MRCFCRIMQKPENLVEMQRAIELYDRLLTEVPIEEEQFPKIADQLITLDKYRVEIPEEMRKMEKNIPIEWSNYKDILLEAEKMLGYSKVVLAKAG